MIQITAGNLLEAQVDALVNTVNCVGFMGKGIALQFKQAFPENFTAYEKACHDGEVRPGHMFIYETRAVVGPKYIINFPTKRHWKGKSKMEDIESGLKALIADVERLGIKSIAVPPLGCGLGGLNWSDVRPRIEKAFRNASRRSSADVRTDRGSRCQSDARPHESRQHDSRSCALHQAHGTVRGYG